MTRCPVCAGLRTRLAAFESGAPGSQADWESTGKRLDTWLADFLGSQTAPSGTVVAIPRPRARWKDTRWRLGWVAGLAAAASVAAAVIIVRQGSVEVRQASIQAHVAVPPAPPANPVPIETPAPTAADEGRTLAAAKPVQKHATPLPVAAAAPVEDQPAAKPEEPQVAQETADEAETPAAPPVSANPTGGGGASRAMGRNSAMSRANLVQPAPPAPVPAAPPTMRLEAGAEVWIRILSLQRQSDGTFTFHGSLLLPIEHAQVAVLRKGTDVYGWGRLSHGQTSLLIQEFAVQRVPYRLIDRGGHARGVISPGMPGSGKTVEFSSGQVLELFLASESNYEKVPN
jgi:hypothetical protein